MVLPIRTCFECRGRKTGSDLLRFTVLKVNGVLVLDGKKKEAGRGVYCCKNGSCLESFARNRKGLKKALRVETLDMSVVEHLL